METGGFNFVDTIYFIIYANSTYNAEIPTTICTTGINTGKNDRQNLTKSNPKAPTKPQFMPPITVNIKAILFKTIFFSFHKTFTP